MNRHSSIAFSGDSRVHIALAVADVGRSRAFYETLLGCAPTKVRPGYVKFEPGEPSVNLTLNEVAGGGVIGRPATHYGVQVKSTDAVAAAAERLRGAGLATRVEENTTCCYAVQDKVWATDPDGNAWEVFVVLESDAPERAGAGSACCTPGVAGVPSAPACCETKG